MESLGVLAILVGFGLALTSVISVVWAFVDIARRPDGEWATAGQNKPMWLAIVALTACVGCVMLGWLGAVAYAVLARPALNVARARATGPRR